MPAVNQRITLYTGDTKTVRVPIRDTLGANVDMTGGSARWKLGKSARARGAGILLAKDTTAGGVTLTNEGGGAWSAIITFAPVDTKTMTPGLYHHELECTDGVGRVATVSVGPFVLKPTINT